MNYKKTQISEIGYLCCWLEEKRLGLESHYKKKAIPEKNQYNIKPFYKSRQFDEAKNFFHHLGKKIGDVSTGDIISDINILNPLNRDSLIQSIEVEKIFSSKAKPILISVLENSGDFTSLIFKKGKN